MGIISGASRAPQGQVRSPTGAANQFGQDIEAAEYGNLQRPDLLKTDFLDKTLVALVCLCERVCVEREGKMTEIKNVKFTRLLVKFVNYIDWLFLVVVGGGGGGGAIKNEIF